VADKRNKVERPADEPHPSHTPKPGRMGHLLRHLRRKTSQVRGRRTPPFPYTKIRKDGAPSSKPSEKAGPPAGGIDRLRDCHGIDSARGYIDQRAKTNPPAPRIRNTRPRSITEFNKRLRKRGQKAPSLRVSVRKKSGERFQSLTQILNDTVFRLEILERRITGERRGQKHGRGDAKFWRRGRAKPALPYERQPQSQKRRQVACAALLLN
jgi:hypothetical protein